MRLVEVEGHHYFEVGPKRWPAGHVFKEDHDLTYTDITRDGVMRSRGCRVMFETGWQVSIIWGNLTYSSNRSRHYLFADAKDDPEFSEEPTAVEIMVMGRDGEPADHGEIVLGWVDAEELTALFNLLSELPTDATFSYDMIRKGHEE